MKDYYEIIKEGLMKAVAAGKRKFILFPYGKQGSLTKSFLNENLGIQEEFIVDNRLSKINEKIKKLEYLTTYHFDDDCVVVITSDHKGIYYELREILYNYVPSENVCDLFECEAEINRRICIEKGKQYRLEEKNNIYKPQNCNSIFFMPYYKRDGIQQAILRTDNYFEYTNLDFVTKIWNGGIISEK